MVATARPQVAGLRSGDAVVAAKSVLAARELLAPPERHIQCIAAGVTPALRELLAATPADAPGARGGPLLGDVAGTLACLVAKQVGARDAIQHGCLPPLLALLEQPDAAVRDAAYAALAAGAPWDCWRSALIAAGRRSSKGRADSSPSRKPS